MVFNMSLKNLNDKQMDLIAYFTLAILALIAAMILAIIDSKNGPDNNVSDILYGGLVGTFSMTAYKGAGIISDIREKRKK